MNSNNYSEIRQAVLQRKIVIAKYKEHVRHMCPHVLGWKNGKEHGLFYQFAGTSSSKSIVPGSQANWRCLDIEELEEVQILDGEWHTASNHSRTQTCVDEIDVEVVYTTAA
jgi:hypothetical protein